jgi:hypothetical protein
MIIVAVYDLAQVFHMILQFVDVCRMEVQRLSMWAARDAKPRLGRRPLQSKSF